MVHIYCFSLFYGISGNFLLFKQLNEKFYVQSFEKRVLWKNLKIEESNQLSNNAIVHIVYKVCQAKSQKR